MLRSGQALRRGQDARAAAREATRAACDRLDGRRADAVWVFATEGYDAQAVLAGVQDVVADAPVTGGRVPGVFCDDVVTHDGIGVLALSGGVTVTHAVGEDASRDGRGAGARAAGEALRRANGGRPHTLLAVLPDAVRANSSEAVRGVADAAGTAVRVVGGGSGDDLHFVESFQFAGDRVVQDAVVATALGTHAPAGIGLHHGCAPWGPPMRVTRARGRVVCELDGRPAFARYADAVRALGLGDVPATRFVDFAMLHPLGVPTDDGDFVLRSPLQLNDDGSIVCCADVPADGAVRVMLGNRISLLDAATHAGRDARAGLRGADPAVGLVFACVSRDMVLRHLRDETSAELAAVRKGLGDGTPLFGCLSFGQIGGGAAQAPRYHSKSIQVCALPAQA